MAIEIATKQTHPEWFLPEDPFEGNFRDYLKLLRRHPAYPEDIHSAFYRLSIRLGEVQGERINQLNKQWDIPGLTAYTMYENFYGIEPQLFKMINGYGGQAAQGGR